MNNDERIYRDLHVSGDQRSGKTFLASAAAVGYAYLGIKVLYVGSSVGCCSGFSQYLRLNTTKDTLDLITVADFNKATPSFIGELNPAVVICDEALAYIYRGYRAIKEWCHENNVTLITITDKI